MEKHVFLEELLEKVEELAAAIEEREVDGDDLSIAHDLIDELRDEIKFRLE